MQRYRPIILSVLLLAGLVWGASAAIKPELHAPHSAAGTAGNSLHRIRLTLAQPVTGLSGGFATDRVRLGIWPQVAALAPGGEPVAPPADTLPGDFNGDNAVGFGDFFLFADVFGQELNADNALFDLNDDEVIDFTDFFIFADVFGQGDR